MLVNYAQKPHESGCWLFSVFPLNKMATNMHFVKLPITSHRHDMSVILHDMSILFIDIQVSSTAKNYVQLYPHISIIHVHEIFP